MPVIPKVIYRFSVIPVKILTILRHIWKLILKYVCKSTELLIAKKKKHTQKKNKIRGTTLPILRPTMQLE